MPSLRDAMEEPGSSGLPFDYVPQSTIDGTVELAMEELKAACADGDLETIQMNQNGANGAIVPERLLSRAYYVGHPEHKVYGLRGTILLAYQTLGVVYGDMGTSPLYVFSSIEHPLSKPEEFLGILSLIFWTVTLVALFKYVFIVLRADDNGEGGTFALYSLLCRHAKISRYNGKRCMQLQSDRNLQFFRSKWGIDISTKTVEFLEKSRVAQKALLGLVMLGTSMVIGDGVLTPAISVLSATVGIKSQNPNLSQTAVVAASVAILAVIFLLQRFGTSKVGFLFSPIMVVWFFSTAIIGVHNIVKYYPKVFMALSPHYIPFFFTHYGKEAWVMLGAVVLCITGAEAMFADLGHFNKQAIQIAFCSVVYPSLILTYAGQAAYLIKNPSDIGDTFYKSTPHSVFWVMFVISTLAAIVASQALISATFSIIKQSIALGCFPRVNIIHTSEHAEGQVYSPQINYLLMFSCIGIVLGFRSGNEIGNAYGVAVMCVMLITTFLVTLVMIILWNLPLPLALAFFSIFGLIEGSYLSSVLNKMPQGGWVPFAISAFFMIIMVVWNHGRAKKYNYELLKRMSKAELGSLLSNNGSIRRVPGMCLFYSDLVHGLPPIISHYVRCVGTLHQVLVFVTFRHIPVRTVLPEERFLVGRLPYKGVYRCVARYGYMDLMTAKHGEILNQIIDNLKFHITSLEYESDDSTSVLVDPDEPDLGNDSVSETTIEEINYIEKAVQKGVVYVMGKTTLRSSPHTSWFQRVVINHVYEFLAKNSRPAMSFSIFLHHNLYRWEWYMKYKVYILVAICIV